MSIMNDSEDVQLLMEFRNRYMDQWVEFLKEKNKYDEWLMFIEQY